MLPSPEERKRLRQEKAAERLRRQQQRKKLFLRLAIAAAVLIGCGVLIVTLSRNKPATSPTETDPAAQTTPGTSAPETVPESTAPPDTVIHYAAVGDLNVNETTVFSGGSTSDYSSTFLDVAALLADADISSVNFEGNFYGAPYGSNHSAPQAMATALRNAGVDLVQMANSYSINRGLAGLSASLDAVRAAGMEPLGAYATNAEFKESKGYTIRTVDGIKLAFVAFTKGMDGMTLPAGSENCVNVLYTDYDSVYQEVDRERILSILDAVAKEKPDLVIALLHWGSEFNNTISSSQEKIVSLMQANGVDAIIGHSHYVQQMKLDAATGQFVAYSLGDFLSDAQKAGSEYSVVLDLEITKNNVTGETKITNYSYTPIFSVNEAERPLRVVWLREAMTAYENNHIDKVSEATYEKMAYAMTRIEARVAGE